MVIVIAIIIIIVIMIIIISNYQFSDTQAMQTKFFIESPPLAGIFAECEWMDWINKETMMMAMMIDDSHDVHDDLYRWVDGLDQRGVPEQAQVQRNDKQS